MARDPAAFIGLMLVRLGFLVALLLGLSFLFGLMEPGAIVVVHMLAGFVTLAGVWLAALRFAMLRRQGVAVLGLAAVVVAVGTGMGLDLIGPGPGTVHMGTMILAVALTEMGAARANRA